MSETRKLYIADWHYAHANILAFDNRPFKTVEEMNEELVKRWNAAVNPGDTVMCLVICFGVFPLRPYQFCKP